MASSQIQSPNGMLLHISINDWNCMRDSITRVENKSSRLSLGDEREQSLRLKHARPKVILLKDDLSHHLSILSCVHGSLCHEEAPLWEIVLLDSHLLSERVFPQLREIFLILDPALLDGIINLKQRSVWVCLVSKHDLTESHTIHILVGPQQGTSHNGWNGESGEIISSITQLEVACTIVANDLGEVHVVLNL